VELTDLLTFSTVARLGGITRAADELNTVQSNVTQRVKALEAEIGTALFERHSRGMTLTGAGRRLLPYAQRMAALSREALLAARDDGEPKGPRSDRWRQQPRCACLPCSPNSTAASRRCG
jgi:DNA-binding transcriptional LysR family regulator